MTNWKEYKLGEIALKITKGTTPSSIGKRFTDKGVNYIKSEAVGYDGIIDTSTFVYIDEETHEKLKRSQLEESDILFSMAGAYLGKTGMVKSYMLPANTNQALALIRLNQNIANPSFILYYLRQNNVVQYVNSMSSQSAQPNVNLNEIGSLIIPLPDLPTQTAIAEILSSLDDKIELNNKINQELENLAQTLFKQWFIDFEFPNQNGEPYKSSGGEMIDSELGEIPKGWEVGSIYDISDVIYGAPFKSKLFNQENKGLPLIRIRDLKTFQPQNWTEEIHPKGTKIYAGDLVVGMDAEFRAHFWLGQPAWLNQRLCHFRPKTCFSKLFVREIIKPQLAFHENSSVGTTVIHLGKGDIDTFKSLIPVNNILLQFEELSNSIFDTIINNSKESQELTKLRNTLLPKLISGELELNNHNF